MNGRGTGPTAAAGPSRIIIHRGRVLAPAGDIEDGVVVIDDGRISFVGTAAAWRARGGGAAAAAAGTTVDAGGGWICPGFIDIHVHGGGGADVMDADWEALRTIARTHARYGTTAFLATTVTADHKRLLQAAEAVAHATGRRTGGAAVLGLHLEGPYLNPKRAGAQNPAHMRPPSMPELERLYEASGPAWRIITLAPELPGALTAVRWLAERGVLVSMGHTDATYDEARAGFEAGIRHATHLFNAMRPWHHREPGGVGAVLDSAAVGAELVADGHHVHPAVLRLAVRVKGPDALCLVTDGMRAVGLPDGAYTLGDVAVSVREGRVTLRDDEGTLAGSVLTMADAVRLMVQRAGVSLRDAVVMASGNPARAAGVYDAKGSLEPGKDGDVVVLNDDDLTVHATVVAGQVVYSQ